MPMAPTPSRPLAGQPAMLDAERRKTPRDPAAIREIVDRVAFRPNPAPIEDRRERAQQEFSQIWNLCTLTH